jgi:hypothetical protein
MKELILVQASWPSNKHGKPRFNYRWRQTITNATFLDAYPQIKMFSFFEYRKFETDGGVSHDERDFRIFSKPELINAFKADFAAVQDRYTMATYVPRAVSGTDSGSKIGSTQSNAADSVFSTSAVATFIFSVISALFD